MPQSPRAKTSGCIASVFSDAEAEDEGSGDEEEEGDESAGTSLTRRWESVIMEPVFGSFFTVHWTEEGEEDEGEGVMRLEGAERTLESAVWTKGFCIRPVPIWRRGIC